MNFDIASAQCPRNPYCTNKWKKWGLRDELRQALLCPPSSFP